MKCSGTPAFALGATLAMFASAAAWPLMPRWTTVDPCAALHQLPAPVSINDVRVNRV
ncbi:MAG TPA: hypothetical protein VK789_32135 [Bryobacteraceae bacterium]|nr:hypothetical protein [Bryobacteraceae bacterium]